MGYGTIKLEIGNVEVVNFWQTYFLKSRGDQHPAIITQHNYNQYIWNVNSVFDNSPFPF